jgi:hypothetical protein
MIHSSTMSFPLQDGYRSTEDRDIECQLRNSAKGTIISATAEDQRRGYVTTLGG